MKSTGAANESAVIGVATGEIARKNNVLLAGCRHR
jgi:hypothetical protein